MRHLYRTYQLLVVAPVMVVATALASLVTIVGCAVGLAHFFSYYPGKVWAWLMVRLLLLPVSVEGREHMAPGQSYVIVPNHQGAFDIFLIYGFLNRHFKWMMKYELRSIPLVGKACESSGFIFVDNRGPKRIAATTERARAILRRGISVVVFPEGARTWDGTMGLFKRGAFQLADQLELPLLPVTINGSFEVLPRSKGFNFVEWHPLSLTIHPPMRNEGQGPEAERATMERVRSVVASALRPAKCTAAAIVAAALLGSCASAPMHIEGETSLPQLEGRMLYLKVYAGGSLRDIDSTRIVHGHFALAPRSDSVCMANLFIGQQSIMPIVLDANELRVVIEEKEHRVEGSALNDSLFAFIELKSAIDDRIAELPHRESQMLLDGMDHDEVMATLGVEARELERQEAALVKRFIKANMDNPLGPGVFMIITSALPYPFMTPEIEELITLASPAFLADPYVSDFVRIARENAERANELR